MNEVPRAIALDVGDRYIGVAATDHTDAIAYRYATIDRTLLDPLIALADVVRAESIEKIIIGVPYHVEDGSETQQTQKTRAFIQELRSALPHTLTYIEVDETLTSSQAKSNIAVEGVSEKEEHAEAARMMLEEYLKQL